MHSANSKHIVPSLPTALSRKAASSEAREAPGFEIDRALFPYASRFLTLKDGTRIHYVDEGEGPVLLLLHGNPTWSFLYRKIIANMRKDHRCVALDYPGYGLSSAPIGEPFSPAHLSEVVGEFVEALDLQEVTVMVQDWGGPIGLAFAIANAERVRGFVIGNTFAWPLEGKGQKWFSAIMGGPVGRSITWAFQGVARFFLRKGVSRPIDPGVRAMYLAPFRSRSRRKVTHHAPKQLTAAKPFLTQLAQGLPELSHKPALLVWGEDDFAFRQPERLRFERLFTNHETVLLQRAGHFIQEDSPDEISAAIRAWSGRRAL
ncbi:MAG: haloalkane dehalogenase [Myxococcota bacterium]